jgi:hypothetical protein
MYNRFIKNWETTIIGLGVIIIGSVMFYQTKIDSTAFLAVLGAGAAVAGIKLKQ